MKLHISKRHWRNYYQINKLLLFLMALVILLSLFPHSGKFKYEFQRGKPWQHDDLIAPFDFAVLKSNSELRKEREEAVKDAYLFFKYNTEAVDMAKSGFLAKLDNELKQNPALSSADPSVKEMATLAGFEIIDSMYRRGIVENTPQTDKLPGDYRIALLKNNTAEVIPLNELFTVNSANNFIIRALASQKRADSRMMLPLLQSSILTNVVYDEDLTRKQKEQALEKISVSRGMVQNGERIIAKGELVTDAKYQQLISLKSEFESNQGLAFNFRLILLGRIVLIAMALMVFALFMFTFRRDIYAENRNVVLLLLLVVIMVSFTTMVLRINPAYLMAVPICLVPIIVRTFYDTRLALFVHIITIILLGFLVPNSFEFLFMQLITGIITIISVVHLHNRSQFFFSSLMIFLSYSVLYVGMTLMQEGSFGDLNLFSFMLFGISALLTLFSYPLIYLFERLFGMVTDVSLIELSDTNSKLLQELAIKAPGTFQHSLLVANISEEAARSVNANALLVRTGALYHDIGKMDMAMYYIENQSGTVNPHDELAYEESARIITGHVIRGIECARENKLPEAIIDFIRTHHGTRYTQYFLQKYRDETEPAMRSESLFRYDGPVPFSKETTIVMMADSIEAAARSLKAPTEEQVSELVERLVDEQMQSGQYNNSLLTLKDIRVIKKIIKKKLLSIFHIRIEYPAPRK